MEKESESESFSGMKSLQEQCCVVVSHFEASDIKKIVKKLKLPHTNLRLIGDEVALRKSTEECKDIFDVIPPTLYAGIALNLLCNARIDKKEHAKTLLKSLWEHENISIDDKRILSFYNFYLDISDGEKITKEKVFQKSLCHKTTPLLVSQFLLQEGAQVSAFPFEDILERRIENEYKMEQPEFITNFLQKKEIIEMCKNTAEQLNSSLNDGHKCDEEALKYACAYGAYNSLFLNTIKKLIALGFVPEKEGFTPKRWRDQNKNDKISVFDFVVESMQDWMGNYALRNTAYAKYMLTIWDTPESHDMNILYDGAIARYYEENLNNSESVDILKGLRAPNYKKQLNAFFTIKHYFYIFGYKALKRLKQFYPEEFKLLKAKLKRDEHNK